MSVDVAILGTGSITGTNFATNPSMESVGVVGTTRTNLITNPAVVGTDISAWSTYPGVGGVATGARTADGANWCYRVTWTTGTTTPGGGPRTYGAAVAGGLYSGRMMVRSSKAQTITLGLEFYPNANGTGTRIGATTYFGPTVALAANTWTEVHVYNVTAPATALSGVLVAYGISGVNWAAGDTLDGRQALMEPAATPGTYFDGTTAAAGDFSYAWSGTANLSTSLEKAATIVGANAASSGSQLSASIDQFHSGTKSLRVVCTNAAAAEGLVYTAVSGTAHTNVPVSAGAWVKAPAGTLLYLVIRMSVVGSDSRTNFTATGAWQRVSSTHAVDPTGAGIQVHVRTQTAQAVTFYVDDVTVTESTDPNLDFNGSTTSSGTTTYAWTGTANASTSTAVTVTSTGLGNATDYSVVEDSTPLDPSSSSGGFGQITITVPEFSGSSQMLGRTVTLSDGAHGVTEGVVATLDSDEFFLTVTANAQLSLLNTTVSAAPYSGTLGGYFAYLLGLVGITSGFQVDSAVTGNAVSLPGWQGNLWDHVKALCAGQRVEVTFVSDLIVMRPLRVNVAQTYRDESRRRTLDNSSIAQQVSCFYYQGVQRSNSVAYPLGGNITGNATIESVDANQTLVTTLALTPTGSDGTGLGASLSSVQQPTCIDGMTVTYTGGSAYTVVGNDNNPYPAAKWVANGGNVTVAVGADNASLVVTLTGCNDISLAPYRLEIADPNIPNVFYSSLYLVGTGVFYNKQLFTLNTGNSAQQTSTVAPPTIDNFAISTISDARSAALWTAANAQGPAQTLSVSTSGINTAGDSNSYTEMTMGQFDSYYSTQTFGQFDAAQPAGETFGQFDTWSEAQVAGEFTNQAFGNVAGARVLYKNAWYRITSATITAFGLTYVAIGDTTMGDLDSVWSAKTFADFDAIWSTKTFGQFTPVPLTNS